MPENMKRKITVEPVSTKNKDAQAQRRPSVFERLGTKSSTSSSAISVSTNNEGTCRNWAQSGTCPYGKSCKYVNTHTLISPSKQRAAKKDIETKQKTSHPSVTPKPNMSVSKEDVNKRLHSTVVVKKTHTGASPELNWENWDQTDLEYEDEKVLEKRRQLLQRELELQMKREKEEQQKKKKVKKVKKGISSSSSTSASSSSSTESSSSSDDSSSTSSSTSGDSRKKKTKPKTPKRDSSSSTSGTDQAAKKKANKSRKSSSVPPANKKTPPARKDDRSSSSKRKESPTSKKGPAGSSKQSLPSGKKRSTTPPGRNRHRSQSPGSKDRAGGSTRTSLPAKKGGGRHSSPTAPKRSQSADRREKRNHSTSPRTSARDREREREKEKEKEKEREREREKDKEREKERERARDQGRSRSPKGKGRDRVASPRRDTRLPRDPRKKGSPDSGNSKDKGGRVSPGKSRPSGSSVRPRDSSLDTKHTSGKNSPSNTRDGDRRESNRNEPRDLRDRVPDSKKSSGDSRRGDTTDKGARSKETASERNNSHRSTKEDGSNRREGDSVSNRDVGRRRDLPMLPGPVEKTNQDRDSKSDKDRIREPRDNSRDNRDGRDSRDNLDPRLSRGNKSLREMKEAEREKEREEALERCRERQRERERKAREEKAREHERELPSLLLITTHNPIKNARSGGREDSKGLDKVSEKVSDRSRERERERGAERERGPERERVPERERGPERAAERDRGPDRDRTTTRGLDRAPDRERGLDRGLDRSLDRGLSERPERERGSERDRVPERGADRDRGLDRGSERERGFDRDRGLDRGPERDRGLDRSLDRDRPLERGLERDRVMERGPPERDRGLERGSDRERGIERGPLDRDRMFDRERGLDRAPIKGPAHDRSLDRVHERSLNRGPSDRNFERSADRSFERDPDRVVFDRDSRDDPGYPMPPRGREDGRRPLVVEEKDYDSPYDSRRGREERGRYGDPLERSRYDDPVPVRDDPRRLGSDARNFPDDRRGRGREGRGSLEPLPWEGRGRDDRGERDRDLHDREPDRRRLPYDREEPRSPVTSLKGRDWEARDYADNRRDWEARGVRRGPPPDWDALHRGEWIDKEGPPLEADWDLYGPGGPGDWPGRERWGDEWERPGRSQARLPPRLPPEYHHPEDLPLAPIEPKDLLPAIGLNGDKPMKEDDNPLKKPDISEAPTLKRPRESDLEGEKPEVKKFCTDEAVPLEPEDLSDISDDDADGILNQEDIEVVSTPVVPEQRHQSPNLIPQPVSSNDAAKKDGEKEKDVEGNEKVSTIPNTEINRDSTDPNSLLQQDDEATLDQLDFEEISDEELEEEARAGLGDALGVDWASLVAESRPRVRSEVQPGSARRRWEGLRMLARLGVSAKYAGQDLVDELSAKLKTIQQEDKENDETTPADDGDFAFLHPVALIHVSLREKQARRKALFSSSGPYKRALSARRDLFIRRQLCNLPINEVNVESQGQNTEEIYRLAVQLFEKD